MRRINDWWKSLAAVLDFQLLGVFIPRQGVSLEDLLNQVSVPGVNLGVTL